MQYLHNLFLKTHSHHLLFEKSTLVNEYFLFILHIYFKDFYSLFYCFISLYLFCNFTKNVLNSLLALEFFFKYVCFCFTVLKQLLQNYLLMYIFALYKLKMIKLKQTFENNKIFAFISHDSFNLKMDEFIALYFYCYSKYNNLFRYFVYYQFRYKNINDNFPNQLYCVQ